MTIDELAAKFENLEQKMDQRFETMDQRFESLEQRMNKRFEGLEQKMDQGFNDSKSRDEHLLGLTRFNLEADEVLRDSMMRRFDDADRKHDEQISLLKDVVRQRAAKP